MDIRTAAYELCKGLAAMPARKAIADLVTGLNNGSLSYNAEQQHAHILGYLMVSQETAQFASKPLPEYIEPLNPQQLKQLAGFHKAMTDMNAKCVSRLSNALPNCSATALSPYNRFKFNMPSDVDDVQIFPTKQLEDLVHAFHCHTQIDVAIQSSSAVPLTFSEPHYMQHIWKLEEDIEAGGALEAPPAIRYIDLEEHRDSQNRTFIRHIAAVSSIRASLSVLNQLIYQKLFADKLLMIDEDRIVKSGAYYLGTGGLTLVFQNANLFLLAQTDDIILSRNFASTTRKTELCRVEKLDPALGMLHIGEPRYVELRVIDENLNPYGLLFRSL
jgi:hypothetical protein